MTDSFRFGRPDLVVRHMPPGSAVIFRDYRATDRKEQADILAGACRRQGVLLLIGADFRMARQTGAAGVHIPSRFRPHYPCPEKIPSDMIVSMSAHSQEDLHTAAATGASIAILSPVFKTASHAGAVPLGPGKFRAMAEESPLPVLALGGVNENNARLLAGRNVAGFAAIGAFTGLA